MKRSVGHIVSINPTSIKSKVMKYLQLSETNNNAGSNSITDGHKGSVVI
jgi:hypothetical protein